MFSISLQALHLSNHAHLTVRSFMYLNLYLTLRENQNNLARVFLGGRHSFPEFRHNRNVECIYGVSLDVSPATGAPSHVQGYTPTVGRSEIGGDSIARNLCMRISNAEDTS